MSTDKGLGAAAVIRNSDGHVLLVKHTYGRLNWEIPGGVVEGNESPSEAAVREAREETGLDVGIDALTGTWAGVASLVFAEGANRVTMGDLDAWFRCGGPGPAHHKYLVSDAIKWLYRGPG